MSILAAAVVVLDVRAWFDARPLRCGTSKKIEDFMVDWISNEGRVAIYTRDMSWAHQASVVELLQSKAANKELIICLPAQIALTEELQRCGADIYTYEQLAYEPRSRFTIVRFGRSDAEVAIGRKIAGMHTIERYAAGQHPAFQLAEDLVEIAKRGYDRA